MGKTISQWEDRLSDGVWRIGASPAPERRLVIVDIDERSLREMGPWPWSRDVHAQLIQRLAESGVRQQVWDVVFAGASPGPAGHRSDEALADALVRHPVTIAQVISQDDSTPAHLGRSIDNREGLLAGASQSVACGAPFPTGSSYLANDGALLTQGPAGHPAVGHIAPGLSGDGVLRHIPAFICVDSAAYPALSLAALDQAAGGGGWKVQGPKEQSELVHASGVWAPIPLDEGGRMRMAWRQHPDGYISISAADVWARRVPSALLDGAWVLVGGSAFGLNDRITTPFQPVSPGFQAHAQVLLNVLDRQIVQPHSGTTRHHALTAAVVAGFVGVIWVVRRRVSANRSAKLVWLPLCAALLFPLLWGLHAALLWWAGVWFPWVLPATFMLVLSSALAAIDHARSRVERERLYQHLSSYLPQAVAQALAGQNPSDRIQARQQAVSVMFADIRNFSAYCEARPPDEAAAVLHTFFTTAARIVHAHGGVVESLQGDSVIATWNAEAGSEANPTPQHRHAQQALAAARELHAAMQSCLPDPAPQPLEPLALGMGLETGIALTGSIGPQERRTHMVLGRTVTIASCLVDMTAELAHPILIGEGMAAQLAGLVPTGRLRSMGIFMLEGLTVPHHVYAWTSSSQEVSSRDDTAELPSAAGAPALTPTDEAKVGRNLKSEQAPDRLH